MANGSLNFAFFSTHKQSGVGHMVECAVVSETEVVGKGDDPPDDSEDSGISGQLSIWDQSPFPI